MKRYLVKWTEYHEAEVEAADEDKAVDEAYYSDSYVSTKKHEVVEIKCLGGWCEEHDVVHEDAYCPKCQSEV